MYHITNFGAVIVVLLACMFSSCSKSEKDLSPANEVKTYIQQLKNGEYIASSLPAFQAAHIPELLKYSDDFQIITNFPHNPISSFYAPECTLGIYALWTIESIRVVSLGSDNVVAGFPSLNPLIYDQNTGIILQKVDTSSQQIVADSYKQWWIKNLGRSFNTFNSTNPLQFTPYQWH